MRAVFKDYRTFEFNTVTVFTDDLYHNQLIWVNNKTDKIQGEITWEFLNGNYSKIMLAFTFVFHDNHVSSFINISKFTTLKIDQPKQRHCLTHSHM